MPDEMHLGGSRPPTAGGLPLRNRSCQELAGDPATETVNHPAHYGGADNPYEAIKVIEAWGLSFNLGNAVKYIARAGKKGSFIEDLKKSRWYLDRAITRLEEGNQKP